MNLCVFQGTFNPIHKAHLDMAEFALKEFNFDKILFIPAYIPPHKNCNKLLASHRLEMVKLATKYNPKFEVSDIEYKNERKSYTYLTILELYKKYDIDDKINFIIGSDAFNRIDTWYEADKLKSLVNFIVFTRDEIPTGSNFIQAKMDFEDISSTTIRANVKLNKDISSTVTKEVKEYIENNGLYKS